MQTLCYTQFDQSHSHSALYLQQLLIIYKSVTSDYHSVCYITTMYKLKLIYEDSKSQHYKESLTHCASIQLYVENSIESYQCSATELLFARNRDRTLAQLALSSNPAYELVVV